MTKTINFFFAILLTLTGCATTTQPQISEEARLEAWRSELALKNARESLNNFSRPQVDVSVEPTPVPRPQSRPSQNRPVVSVQQERPIVPSYTPGQRRVAAPQNVGPRPVPCYLHRPPNVPQSELVEFPNELDRPVGLRIDGQPVQVVGATMPTYAALPAGVHLQPSMIPPGMRCYYAMQNPGGGMHVDVLLYRIDPYSGGAQLMAQNSAYVEIAYPRRFSYILPLKNSIFRR